MSLFWSLQVLSEANLEPLKSDQQSELKTFYEVIKR